MKVWIAADGDNSGEITAHSKREEAETEAKRRVGDGGIWSTASGQPVYKTSSGEVRVVERPVTGDPLGE